MFRTPSDVFTDAVREYWRTRGRQAQAQVERGIADQGTRSAATGGAHMNGFIRMLTRLLMNAAVLAEYVYTARSARLTEGSQNTATVLPDFYRPTKDWDLVLVANGQLVAALELKSQIGPSFGNNFNNRTEEAIGTAQDIWTAYREGAFRTSPAPWLGYLFLLEDCPRSRAPVSTRSPHFPIFPEFVGASYALRYELLCRKLVRERQYSAACFLMADPNLAEASVNYTEPAEDLGAGSFVGQLLAHATAGL